MLYFIDNFVEVIWKHGSESGSRSGSRSAIQIFLEAKVKRHHFHITGNLTLG